MSNQDKHDGRNSPVSELLPVVGEGLKGVGNKIADAFKREKGKGPTKKEGKAPEFGAKPPKEGGRKRRKTRRKRRKSRRKRRKSRRKRRKSRRKKKR